MKKRILLIEDDELIREMYASELAKNDFEVFAFSTGEEGLKVLEQNQFDLILLDIMLPGLNGLEILKEIKQNPLNKNVKVVLMTNLGQETIIKEGFQLGADGYLIKAAYNPDQIIQEVRNFIDGKNTSTPDTNPI